MPDTSSLDRLQNLSLKEHPNITQLLRSIYQSLGAPITADSATEAGFYSAHKLTQDLGLDQDYRAVCVVLIDGLGIEQLQACRAHTPFLRNHRTPSVKGHTVLPSTTATALTSLTTGAFVAQTNMFGWSVKTPQGIGNLINFQNITLSPQIWQPVEPLFTVAKTQYGVETQVISHPRFANSGLTQAAFRGANFVGAETFDQRITAGIEHLQRGSGLAYLYWSELDHIGHEKGWQSLEWVEELEQVDAKLKTLVSACPADAAVIFTADHGMIDVDPRQRIDLADHPQLAHYVTGIAGEGRCVQLHIEPGQTQSVVSMWKDFFGEKVLLTTDPSGVFRGRPSALFTADALVFSLENQVIVDSRTQPAGQVNLVGVHGSVTEAELGIPMWRIA